MANTGCPTCGQKATTNYQCLSCNQIHCNSCRAKAGQKCPNCGKDGKRNA